MESVEYEEETFRDHISTVNEKGKRVWIFPKRPKGKWYSKRKIVSYFLLAFSFIAPHSYFCCFFYHNLW